MGKLYGLHIGVQKYGRIYDASVNRLTGCYNDMNAMSDIAKRAGALSVVTMGDAKRYQLEEQLRRLAFDTKDGDILLFTYAGHGYPVPNNTNNDPADGRMDETICLSDAIVTDDDLYELFSAFKPGVRIVCFFDSCHSGSLGQWQEAPLGGALDQVIDTKAPFTDGLEARRIATSKYEGFVEEYENDPQDILPPVSPRLPLEAVGICYSACGDTIDDIAYEENGGGIFTNTTRSILADTELDISYLELMQRIKSGRRLGDVSQHPIVTPLPSSANAKRKAFYQRERFLQL